MCGIIGITSTKQVSSTIINSLKKLEYRGYDSAGIATLNDGFINEKFTRLTIDLTKLDQKIFYGLIAAQFIAIPLSICLYAIISKSMMTQDIKTLITNCGKFIRYNVEKIALLSPIINSLIFFNARLFNSYKCKFGFYIFFFSCLYSLIKI
mgnify:CR=1 FL=1